ncbi:putative AT hook domain-containing protein [Rosellinia necatrix]|uniref:Putative AT hook domain-containing protein n=1 Tax=Rosellinia necatrix TaxID=77044 RepID=A0A1S7UK63_ROSNE|nr:putative AT hook domain-containing protein [Rosellinia necatrix]
MELSEMPEQYYTLDGRVASFYPPQAAARRGSTTKGKASKTPSWPHKGLDPETFARAGFYFAPGPENPDNTACFLCGKNIDGWDEDDNPFQEHLRLSPHCGWAVVAGIETGLGDYGLDDPTSSAMIDARKDTFGDRWPHDGKRGWKCKTKQLVDAGWKYTPTMDSDDMATCTYCQLALDGWEPKDNPMDEHYRRSPECPFFILINQYKSAAPAKKKGRGKAARSSKASRLSTQSVATTTSDVTSLLDHPADQDDSILTTTSIMTQGGTKRPRAKKAATAKGKKVRTKKEEPVQVLEDPPEDAPLESQENSMQMEAEEPSRKPARGRKRASATMEDSVLATEAPAPKKRATRGRAVSAKTEEADTSHTMFDPAPPEIDDATIDTELKALEAEMEAEPVETLQVPKKGRQAGTRKASKQTTKKSKAKAPVEPTPEPEPELIVDETVDELADGPDGSIMSNATVVRTSLSSVTGPKKRGRPSKKSMVTQVELQPEPAGQSSPEPEDGVKRFDFAEPETEPAPAVVQKAAAPKLTKKSHPSRDKSLPPPPPESDDIERPTTPTATVSPVPSAKQATVSPPQSPQSSDAENQPPSSKPSNTARSARVALAPVAATPVPSSPSKRNIIAGLESTHAWTAADVELILDELDGENALSRTRLLKSGTDLTSPEKQMSVEEWIYHNAERAERQLKHECEAIVMAFEHEGTKAMQALEGVIVE